MALVHAILSALTECPCSGYDLAKQFDGSLGFFWKASYQQIYRELSKLEDQGWVSSETVYQKGRPDKKLYWVTEQGKNYLREWIAQPSEVSPKKDELLVKLFAGYLVPKKTIVVELERNRPEHLEILSVYYCKEQRYFQNPQKLPLEDKFRYLTLRRSIHYETDWLAWCEEALQLLDVTD
ncbi:PadR family transcriptional regulator [Cyanobacteria bacterium FACHB-472]|nr:PadR family transcriptional regulator [Cyanobacteria bacterium FACHB-472]